MVPCISGPAVIVLFIFLVWMIVDYLSRLPCDFLLLFTTQYQHEKWIWLAIVILVFPVGAIVYFFLIRKPTQQIAPPSSEQKPPPAPRPPAVPERPLRPARRARSIKGLVIITILLAILIPILVILTLNGSSEDFVPRLSPHLLRTIYGFGLFPVATIVLLWLIFWICMLIDCLSRDYREFGTLITSDKSADKLVWVLLILFLPIIGAIAYHISIRRRATPG